MGQPTIPTNWVLTKKVGDGKKNGDFKARLTVRGDMEQGDSKTDSPTVNRESVKLAMALAAANNFEIATLDVCAAFLQGVCPDRTIFLRPPPEVGTDKIWVLRKPAYGLKDASRLWYKALRIFFLD